MSDYDRNATARWGSGVAQAGTQAQIDQGLRSYMLGVYNYMTVGVAVTGLTALATNMMATTATAAGRPALTQFGQLIYVSPLKWVIMLAPIAFVLFFSFRIDRMAASTAKGVFFLFAAVMGLSLSSILVVFTGASITRALFITAATFGALSLYGYTTKKDLSAFGTFLIMGLIGLIIASIVNIFLGSSALSFAISVITVLVFAGFTAWDTQTIKEMYFVNDDYETATKKSVFGALQLYLDFINIFTAMLNLTGSRNE